MTIKKYRIIEKDLFDRKYEKILCIVNSKKKAKQECCKLLKEFEENNKSIYNGRIYVYEKVKYYADWS